MDEKVKEIREKWDYPNADNLDWNDARDDIDKLLFLLEEKERKIEDYKRMHADLIQWQKETTHEIVDLRARIKELTEGIEKHRWDKWGYGEDSKEGRFYEVGDYDDEELYHKLIRKE